MAKISRPHVWRHGNKSKDGQNKNGMKKKPIIFFGAENTWKFKLTTRKKSVRERWIEKTGIRTGKQIWIGGKNLKFSRIIERKISGGRYQNERCYYLFTTSVSVGAFRNCSLRGGWKIRKINEENNFQFPF